MFYASTYRRFLCSALVPLSISRNKLISLLVLFAFALQAQPVPKVDVALSSTEVMFGEEVVYALRISVPPGVELLPLVLSPFDEVEGMEVLGKAQQQREGANGEQLIDHDIRLIFWDSGYYELPPLSVGYRSDTIVERARTQRFRIQVRGLPVASDTLRLMPIRPIIPAPRDWRDFLPYIWGLLLLSALAILGYWLYRRRKPIEQPPPPPRRLPLRDLMAERLQRLADKQLWQQGHIKDYHSELAYEARFYLEHRYRVPALELTTEEILEQLRKAGLATELRQEMRQLLQAADLVKFAKATPPDTFHEQAMGRLQAFVQQTEDPKRMALVYATGVVEAYDQVTEDNTEA